MSEIVLPPLTPKEIASRDYQEALLDKGLRECWHGNNFDAERAEKLARAYVIEIFNVIRNFYSAKVGYRAECLPEIVLEAEFRTMMVYKGHREQGLGQIIDSARDAVMHHLRTTSTSERAWSELKAAFSETTKFHDSEQNEIPRSKAVKSQPEALPNSETIIDRRATLLDEYKRATGANDYQIYNAQNSHIHKLEFYQWKKGKLPENSKTAKMFEAFLKAKKNPIRKSPTN